MKKLIALLAALGTGGWFGTTSIDWAQVSSNADRISEFGQWLSTAAEKNPIPIMIASGTFFLTFVYYWFKSRSLKIALKVATTRVPEVPVTTVGLTTTDPVVLEAQQRLLAHQLQGDQIRAKDNVRQLPAKIEKASARLATAMKEEEAALQQYELKKAAASKVAQELQQLQLQLDESTARVAQIDKILPQYTKA